MITMVFRVGTIVVFLPFRPIYKAHRLSKFGLSYVFGA